VEISRRALADRIARWTGEKNAITTAIPSLTFHRWEHPTDPTSHTLESSICLIAHGRKRVLLGEESYVYDARHFLITSVDLPVVAQIIEASKERPYLGLTLQLDLREISQLMVDSNIAVPRARHASRGMAVGELSMPLLDALLRLIDLLDEPPGIPILAPLVQREILYRLLVGEQSSRLRLNEARRLMLTEHVDAGAAAFQVGYESPSQFSSEYSRLFGAPPLRDIKALGQIPASDGA
jgi:hypothetical protein